MSNRRSGNVQCPMGSCGKTILGKTHLRSSGLRRGMRLGELDTKNSRYQALFTVSGFGSHGVLSLESGLHVFEVPKNKSRFNRIRARVQVAPVPTAAQDKQVNRGAKATRCLDEAAVKVEIVRRYRQQPSPLVRDSIRGWRTGRLDRVFDGNFDVLT